MSQGNPVESMATRLIHTAARHGIDQEGAALIDAAFREAVQPRHNRSERNPDLLHPARTVLILLDDAGLSQPTALAAGALAESENVELALSAEWIAQRFGEQVTALVRAVPRPAEAGDELLEALLAAPFQAQLIALAERLDHARHLHLRPRESWSQQHLLVGAVYLPLADRTDSTLARRLRWWYQTFERRFR